MVIKMNTAFQINKKDNVAVAINGIQEGEVKVVCESDHYNITAIGNIPKGHKIAVQDICAGEHIVKYGVDIGVATKDISAGQWVHLHCMKSFCDERSSHLDVMTGEPSDIAYL